MKQDSQIPWFGLSKSDFAHLADRHGTPFYLFDADQVNSRIRYVRDSLSGLARVYYAVKSNPNLELLRAMGAVVDGLDISSGGELEQATLAGFEAARMSFAGPAKTAAEIDAAVRAGVGCISVESEQELRTCVRLAREQGRRAHVGLRVNPSRPNRGFALKMGGRAVQFGIDEEALPAIEVLLRAHSAELEFVGIHVYAGSQCFDPEAIVEGAKDTLRVACEIEDRSGLACRRINFGGGFGVSHGEESRELDLERTSALLLPVLKEFRAQRDAELIFELGRYLTGPAGIFVTRVVSSKESRGKQFFACDGGLNHHLAAAGTFGAALRSNFALCNLSRDGELVTCNICGPSCNPTDLLGVDARISQPREGDLVGVLKSGSYGLTASPILFLSHPTPVELVRRNGEIVVGRRARSAIEFN